MRSSVRLRLNNIFVVQSQILLDSRLGNHLPLVQPCKEALCARFHLLVPRGIMRATVAVSAFLFSTALATVVLAVDSGGGGAWLMEILTPLGRRMQALGGRQTLGQTPSLVAQRRCR